MQHHSTFAHLVEEIRPQIKEITPLEVQQKLAAHESFTLIDVREDHEWSVKHIPQAIHIGRGILERDITTTIADHSQPIVLYCGGGFRSALAAYNLQKMGYTSVYSMSGGIREWQELNFPLNN